MINNNNNNWFICNFCGGKHISIDKNDFFCYYCGSDGYIVSINNSLQSTIESDKNIKSLPVPCEHCGKSNEIFYNSDKYKICNNCRSSDKKIKSLPVLCEHCKGTDEIYYHSDGTKICNNCGSSDKKIKSLPILCEHCGKSDEIYYHSDGTKICNNCGLSEEYTDNADTEFIKPYSKSYSRVEFDQDPIIIDNKDVEDYPANYLFKVEL